MSVCMCVNTYLTTIQQEGKQIAKIADLQIEAVLGFVEYSILCVHQIHTTFICVVVPL